MIVDDRNRIFVDPVGDTTGEYTGLWQCWALEDSEGAIVISRSRVGEDPGIAFNLIKGLPDHGKAWERCESAKSVRYASAEESQTYMALLPDRWGPDDSDWKTKAIKPFESINIYSNPDPYDPAEDFDGGTCYIKGSGGHWHHEPCDDCDRARPWNTQYETCKVHSILPCSCKGLDWDKPFEHYCEKHGQKSNVMYKEMRYCSEKCHTQTMHGVQLKVFIGCDGGVGGETCLTCGWSRWCI